MTKTFAFITRAATLLLLAAMTFAAASVEASPIGEAPQGKTAVPATENSGIDAAKLWEQTCSRCHNARPATTYSKAQWTVVVQHMRTRAYLTGGEARALLAFLQKTE